MKSNDPISAAPIEFSFSWPPPEILLAYGTAEIRLERRLDPIQLLTSNDWDNLIGRAAELAVQDRSQEERNHLLYARICVLVLSRKASLPKARESWYSESAPAYCYDSEPSRCGIMDAASFQTALQMLVDLRQATLRTLY